MSDNVISFDKYYRLRKRQQVLRATEASDANLQAHAFLQLCEAGFLPRTQLANVASYLPLPALIVLKELLEER
jgi:hypothetical protein